MCGPGHWRGKSLRSDGSGVAAGVPGAWLGNSVYRAGAAARNLCLFGRFSACAVPGTGGGNHSDLTDLELLREYQEHGLETAFTALVQRHVNLVYSAAFRHVRSRELAEESTQSVFIDLAQKSRKLKANTILSAWLYQVARARAIDVFRRESRRQMREQSAVEVTDMNPDSNLWSQIEPLFEDAMRKLNEGERVAIVLRYFENKSLREVV